MRTCKACGLDVVWKRQQGIKGKRDQWQCFNSDGKVHWDLCSKTKFERIKCTGERFEGEYQEGYITSLKPSGKQLTLERAPIIRSAVRSTGQCRSCCPPWEVCAACPDKLQHHQGEKHGTKNQVATVAR